MWTGVVMVGPKAGQRTECKAKDPDTCRYHKKGSHAELTREMVDRFNEKAVRDLEKTRRADAAARRGKTLRKTSAALEAEGGSGAAAGSLPAGVAELAEELDSEPDSGGDPMGAVPSVDSRSGDAIKAATSLHGAYDGSAEMAGLSAENAAALAQAADKLESTHPEWLGDAEVGPFICMPGDEVEFRGPNGKTASTILQPGRREGELLSSTGEVMIVDGVVAYPGVSFVRLSKPAGVVTGYGHVTVPAPRALKFASRCKRGTVLLVQQPDAQPMEVVLAGDGEFIVKGTREVHRLMDLQGAKILDWRRPATYAERRQAMFDSMLRVAVREGEAEAIADNEARKTAWENRSTAQRMLDRVRGRSLSLKPIPTASSSDERLFAPFISKHSTLASKVGLRLVDGKIALD